MDSLTLARWQFGITTVYHFFFVPSHWAWSGRAGLHTAWVATRKPVYLKLTKFWGKLFLINFAMGCDRIVQEFQFGMNWSEYSRYVGDVFGRHWRSRRSSPSSSSRRFSVSDFRVDRLPSKVHLASIWLVAIGSNLSALWILIANSFMQQPVGYACATASRDDELLSCDQPHCSCSSARHHGRDGDAGFFILASARGSCGGETRRTARPSPLVRIGATYGLIATWP